MPAAEIRTLPPLTKAVTNCRSCRYQSCGPTQRHVPACVARTRPAARTATAGWARPLSRCGARRANALKLSRLLRLLNRRVRQQPATRSCRRRNVLLTDAQVRTTPRHRKTGLQEEEKEEEDLRSTATMTAGLGQTPVMRPSLAGAATSRPKAGSARPTPTNRRRARLRPQRRPQRRGRSEPPATVRRCVSSTSSWVAGGTRPTRGSIGGSATRLRRHDNGARGAKRRRVWARTRTRAPAWARAWARWRWLATRGTVRRVMSRAGTDRLGQTARRLGSAAAGRACLGARAARRGGAALS